MRGSGQPRPRQDDDVQEDQDVRQDYEDNMTVGGASTTPTPIPPDSSDTATPLPEGVEIIKKPLKDWIDPLMRIIRDAIEEKTGNTPDSFRVLEITALVARLINQHLDPLQIDHAALTPVPVGTHDPRLPPPPPPMAPRAPGEIAAPGTLPSDESDPTPKPPPGDTKIQMNAEE